jgi:type IV fimbrial biogenesis protein FimT
MDRTMRNPNGFTLVELMVVIAITALMLAIGLPAFSTWKHRHDVESQMNQLYGDLQFARSTAYVNKKLAGISWSGTSFSQYQILTNAGASTYVTSTGSSVVQTLGPMTAPMSASPNAHSITFNGRGFVSGATTLPLNIYVSSSYGTRTTCVSVSLTRITLGTWQGGNCVPQ